MSRRPLLVALALTALLVGCSAGGAGRDSGPAALQVDSSGWKTDFSKHSVPLDGFVSGGPPRDGIPPIDDPDFVEAEEASRWIDPQAPVIAVVSGADARAYPHQILAWHEIVNDELGGRPVAVTYCPLCNSGVVFSREVDGRVLRLGTTGNLRNSDLVMWDNATESWWQQLSGEALVGSLTGAKLEPLPSQTLSFADFRRAYPNGQVLSRDTGFDRDYGQTPYAGYDDPDSDPFLLEKAADSRLPPKERVVAIVRGERAVVVPFSRLAEEPVVELSVGEGRLVVLFAKGVRSPLDAPTVTASRDIGTAGVFEPSVNGRSLAFTSLGDGRFRDEQTGSLWDLTGRAREGPLEGARLNPVVHDLTFWFAIAAGLPDVEIE